MTACDAIVVGGGPAGSTVAHRLREAGADVVVIDRARFPRDKRCAGWITPQVVETLALDLDDYRRRRVLQPITAFRTCRLGGPPIDTDYGRVVSYGIRRWEFDDYLLARSGARLATRARRVARRADRRGLGGGRRVARAGRRRRGRALLPRRAPAEPAHAVRGGRGGAGSGGPDDARAGRALPRRTGAAAPRTSARTSAATAGPSARATTSTWGSAGSTATWRTTPARSSRSSSPRGDVPPDLPSRWPGHAYLLHTSAPRAVVADGVVLVGDAAGLAYPESGEGIRPAIESGVLAARAILAAKGRYGRDDLAPYAAALGARLDAPPWRRALGALVPRPARAALGRYVLSTRALTRHVVLDGWFLRAGQPALTG